MRMKIILILFQTIFFTGVVMASGIVEYKGQNYFTGMMTSGWAIIYALDSSNDEVSGFAEQGVIADNKFFFIESLTGNFNIKEKLSLKGYLDYGDEIEIKELDGVPYRIIKNEYGESQKKYTDFECLYHGEKIHYNKNEDDDDYLDITIFGYASERKIIITEIILTEEDIEQRVDEFRKVD